MNQIQSEFDRLLSRYGSPIKPPQPWKRVQVPKLNTSIAKLVKTSPEKIRLSALDSREQKSV